jgi:glycerol-3-phosphate dehydrogenase
MKARQQPEAPAPHYPVLIIGAGINGCGVFRDLCLQGVDCLLIDRGDVCEGASAASSRLIHGGIKYLETGEFRLVRESAMERNRLLRNAPHYVKPLETILPLRSWLGGIIPSARRCLGLKAKLRDRGAAITALGLRIYDVYSREVRALPNHHFLTRSQLRAEYPDLNGTIIAAGFYHEAHITHAERLGFELVSDGLIANPGSALSTYTTATAGTAAGEIRLTDLLTGNIRKITADVIVNAGGAWIDKVNASLGISSRHIGGSKGSHLILDNPQLFAALKGRMIYFGTADGRVNLVYPFFGHVLVGSTDIPVANPDEATCTDAETDDMLGTVHDIFPAIDLTREQVLLTYCGVRPLPRATVKDIGSVSRDHSIAQDVLPHTNRPVLSLIGGKWTTFRAFSAQVTDRVLPLVGGRRVTATENLAIGGGRDFPATDQELRLWSHALAGTHRLDPSRAQQLLLRYGTRATLVADLIMQGDDHPLISLPGYSTREIIFLCREEHVRRLADVLFRRTAIAMEGALTPTAIAEVADVAAAALDWDAPRQAQEIHHCTFELNRRQPLAQAA